MSTVSELAHALAEQAHLEPALLSVQHLAPLVAERRRALRLRSDDDYARHALHNAEEFGRLRDLIAVPETWLFRYPASFELLRAALGERRATSLRALSVPCATGAEPFSIAATALAAGVPAGAVHVVGVDSSAAALERARTGQLSRLAIREGIPAWATPWFAECADGMQASDVLRARVDWVEGTAPSALREFEAGSFDIIFCRNLAIYMRGAARLKLGTQLERLLAPDGMLFLGHAEPAGLFGLAQTLVPLEPRASFAFSKCAAAPPPAPDALESARPAAIVARPGSASRAHPVSAIHRHTAKQAPSPGPPTLDAVRAAADAGRLQEALDLGRKCIAAGERSCELLLVLGSAHAALGQHAPAEELLRQVVYLEPDHAEALLHLAALAEARGDGAMAARYRARAAKVGDSAGDAS